jgi:hypothetical protein
MEPVALRKKADVAMACLALAAALALLPGDAAAHVKWFTEFDNAKPPLPLSEVVTGTFVAFFVASIALTYGFFVADRYAYKNGYLVALDLKLRRFDGLSIHVMRGAAAVFFVSLFLYDRFTGVSFFLTPELRTDAPLVPWFQLALGLCALWRPALPAVGAGILALYAASVQEYGLYHLIDYLIFLGIAYFFLVANLEKGAWKKSGFVVLYALMGLTLLWASVEKWGYPQWTYPLLEKDPGLLMGMDPYTYMVLAGFVEFNIIFLLLGAASIVTRIIALGLQAVFILAIFKFGLIDAVGHLMIIAILFVLIVRGPTDARNILVLREKSVAMEAYFMTGLYYLAFVTVFLLYYGLHHLYYGI